MSKRNSNKAPLAPAKVKFWTRVKLRRQGRQDAKMYKGIQDFTRTHALIVSQSIANAGQRRVNQWFIDSLTPILAGNARLKVQRESVEMQIADLVTSTPSLSGRNQKRVSGQIDSLDQELVNLKSQYRSNIATADSIEAEAEQSLDSWKSHFNEMAAIYTRARSRNSIRSQATAPSGVPQFESLSLAEMKQVRQRDWDLDPSHESAGV